MKLIYIAPFLHPSGGLERTLTDKANWLAAYGHEVLLLTYEQGGEKMFYAVDQRVQQMDIDCRMYAIYRQPFYTRLGAYLRLRRQFRERFGKVLDDYRPEAIVITIPNTEDFLGDMVKVARQHGVKVVIESHLASPYHQVGKPFTERMLCRLNPPAKHLRQADLLIALTEGDAQLWRGILPQVRVIPNPLPSCFSSLTTHSLPLTSDYRIIAVGRLFEQKRFDRLIAAFGLIAHKHPEWCLDILGDGPLRDSLQEQIKQLRLEERVQLKAPTHQIVEEYQQSRFFVLSSDYEGFGMVIIEAMACGLPVVATACPYGPSEIIEDGKTGLLSQLDVQDLAAKMEWMITHEEEREAMGHQAQEASKRYQLERVMPQWLAAYQSVL